MDVLEGPHSVWEQKCIVCAAWEWSRSSAGISEVRSKYRQESNSLTPGPEEHLMFGSS